MDDLPPTRVLTPDDGTSVDEEELLFLFEQAISAGEVDDQSRISWVRLGGSERWTNALECLELMSRVWPRPQSSRPADDLAGKCLGRFRLQKELGRGGTSVVFLAVDPLLNRHVALKVPRPATLAAPELRRRFLQEGRAAAALKHRNIVTVFEAVENKAACYLVSEYCRGPSLAEWLKERTRLVPPRVSAEWLADLAEAVHHAHEQGILHRDIKPSNVLLEPKTLRTGQASGEFDFVVKLSDFGLAKVRADAGDTRTGAILGTPAYMSPEQAAGRVRNISEVSDVYSLGALLYELLSGRPPFQGESDIDLLQQVVHDDPVPPRKLSPSVPRDLETICLKCLAKDPAKRYPSAHDLAEDLGRFLSQQPIRARAATRLDLAARWVRRNPILALSGVFAGAALVLLGVGLAWHFQTIGKISLDLADTERRRQEGIRVARAIEEQAQRQEDAAAIRSVQSLVELKQFPKAVRLLEVLRERSSPEAPNFAWRYWWNVCRDRDLFPLVGNSDQVRGIAMSPDGRRIAGCLASGRVVIWDNTSAAVRRELEAFPEAGFRVTFSPGGRYLAAISEKTALVTVWETAQWQPVRHWEPRTAVSRKIEPDLGFSPDDQTLGIATEDYTVTLLNVTDGKLSESHPHPHHIKHVRFLPRGKRLVTGAYDGVRVWSSDLKVEERHFPARPWVTALAVSSDGQTLAYGQNDSHEVVVCDVAGGQTVVQLSHSALVGSLAFSEDGHKLLVTTKGQTVVWSLPDRVRVGFNSEAMRAGDLARNGRVAALVDWDGQAWLYRLDSPREKPTEPRHPKEAWAVAYHPRGQWMATGSDDNSLVLWERSSGRRIWTFQEHTGTITQTAFTSRGDELVSASLDDTLSIVDVATGRLRTWLKGHTGRVRCVAISPDDRWIASGAYDGTVRIWDLKRGTLARTLTAHAPRRLRSLVFAPNGTMLSGCEGGWVATWDTRNWELVRKWKDADEVWCLAVSPDGRVLAQGNRLGVVTLRDTATGTVRRTLQGHYGGVRSLAFSPQDNTLASGSVDRYARLWDVSTGQELSVLKRHREDLHDVAYSPDGLQLASTSHDGRVHLWDAPLAGNVFLPAGLSDHSTPESLDQVCDRQFPLVTRMVPVGPAGNRLGFQVHFSKEVTGVDASDFRLHLTGSVEADGRLDVVRESGTCYSVEISGVGGTGAVRLDLVDDRTIRDLAGNPLTARTTHLTLSPDCTLPCAPLATDVVANDLNGDRLVDLLVASAGSTISLWMGHEDRYFPAQTELGPLLSPRGLATGDLNGDHFADIVTANAGDSTQGVLLGVPGTIPSQSLGSFLEPQLLPVGPFPERVVLTDFNGDRRLDALLTTTGAASVSLLLGVGNGEFEPELRVPLPAAPRSIATGDVDNDGREDFVALLADGRVVTQLGNGNGAFREPQVFSLGTSPQTLALLDFDSDGALDLMTTTAAKDKKVVVLRGNERGAFGKPQSQSVGKSPQDLVVVDLNADGALDIAVLDSDGTLSVFLASGAHLPQRQILVVGKHPTAMATGDFNGDHRIDLAVLDPEMQTLTVWINDFRGDFQGPAVPVGKSP